MSEADPKSILFTGADVGDVVEGLKTANRGLILRLKQEQPKGHSGRLIGRFEILSSGGGDYGEHLREFVGQSFSCRDLIDQLLEKINLNRKKPLKTLQIFNCNILGVKGE